MQTKINTDSTNAVQTRLMPLILEEKIKQLNQQERPINYINFKYKDIVIFDFDYLINRKTTALPAAISYYSKGEAKCLNGLLARNWDKKKSVFTSIKPQELYCCRHFAIGYAINAFKPKEIIDLEQLKKNSFFQSHQDDNTKKKIDNLTNCDSGAFALQYFAFTESLAKITAEDLDKIVKIIMSDKSITTAEAQKLCNMLNKNLPASFDELAQNFAFIRDLHLANAVVNAAILMQKPIKGGVGKLGFYSYYLQDSELNKKLSYRASDNYSFSMNSFPRLLSSLGAAIYLEPQDITYAYIWKTANHAMSLKIVKKGIDIKIQFYDPGKDTSRVKNIWVASPIDLENITMDELIDKESRIFNKIELDSLDSEDLHTSCLVSANFTSDEKIVT